MPCPGCVRFEDKKNGLTATITLDPDGTNTVMGYAASFFTSQAPCDYLKGYNKLSLILPTLVLALVYDHSSNSRPP